MNELRDIQIYKDGDKWCALWGVNLQEDNCGFGDTPEEAILELARDIALGLNIPLDPGAYEKGYRAGLEDK